MKLVFVMCKTCLKLGRNRAQNTNMLVTCFARRHRLKRILIYRTWSLYVVGV